MKIGSLYTVKKFCWLLFPTKETAADNASRTDTPFPDRITAAGADYWSRVYNCEVTSPESFIVFLEEDGKYKKVLTSDGRIGWTWFIESYNECFEEAT